MAGQNLEQTELLNAIKEEQSANAHVSESFVAATAEQAGLTQGEVYGVTTFYSFLTTQPQGKYVIRVCKSVPCCMADAEKIIDWIASELEIEPGQTTADNRFTLELVNCIGACDVAPAMLIDDKLYGELTLEKTSEILKSYE